MTFKPEKMDWAIVTPSYFRDIKRCQLLCRSIDTFVEGNWHHYIIVDRPDYELFMPLNGPRRTVLIVNDVLPKGTYRYLTLPFVTTTRFWWSWFGGPVAGWQVQQIVKLNLATLVQQRALMYCDSDMLFLRPLRLATLVAGDRVRMFCAEAAVARVNLNNPDFYTTSEKYLGIADAPAAYSHYVDNVVTWHRQTVIDLLDHISKIASRPWHEILKKPATISEYTLYGLFVDFIQPQAPHVFRDHTSLCKTIWQNDGRQTQSDFFEDLAPHEVAVGIQSFLGADISVAERYFDSALQTAKMQ